MAIPIRKYVHGGLFHMSDFSKMVNTKCIDESHNCMFIFCKYCECHLGTSSKPPPFNDTIYHPGNLVIIFCFVFFLFFLPHLHHNVFCAQLEYRLEQERRQRSESEKGRRKLEGDGRSTQPSLGEMEKNRSGLEELIKRSERRANRCHGPQSV